MHSQQVSRMVLSVVDAVESLDGGRARRIPGGRVAHKGGAEVDGHDIDDGAGGRTNHKNMLPQAAAALRDVLAAQVS